VAILDRLDDAMNMNPARQLNASNSAEYRLIVLSRYPTPGKAKTRLIPALGRRGAASLSRQMTALTLARALHVRSTLPVNSVEIDLVHTGASARRMRRLLLGHDLSVQVSPQGGGDLGDRMYLALSRAGGDGVEGAILFGTDIPELTSDNMMDAISSLSDTDLVLGPTEDGGYYLIGAGKRLLSSPGDDILCDIFSGIPWGTGDVFGLTMEKAAAYGLTTTLLSRLGDVDEPSDLPIWESAPSRRYILPPNAAISVIIPTKNEGGRIGETISALNNSDVFEVIVADGFSEDETQMEARRAGATVIPVPPPRGRQLNRAAACARGDILFFLHADTTPPPSFPNLIREALSRPGVSACSFSLGIRGESWKLRWVERNATRRSIEKGLPYGDQGICIGRELFFDAGGFRELPIMEDYEFVRRIGRFGTVVTLPHRVLTSPRRWESLGLVRTTAINQAIILAYRLGVSPEYLVRWYRRESGIERKRNR